METPNAPMDVKLRAAAAHELIDLRHVVLRYGLAREEAMFDGDDLPTTRHFAAETGGRVVACLTYMRNTYKGEPAWQLRGMAVDAALRRAKVGGRLLAHAEPAVLADWPTGLLWCNARKPAIGFYQSHGWVIDSEEFVIPTAGPHHVMFKRF